MAMTKDSFKGPDEPEKPKPSRGEELETRVALAIQTALKAQRAMEEADTPLKEKNAGWYGLESVVKALRGEAPDQPSLDADPIVVSLGVGPSGVQEEGSGI